jgi:nuclear pore complex protein Nup155
MMLDSLEVSYLSPIQGKADEVGAIELPLQTAAKVDPDDLALDYLRDGTRDNDRRKEIYDAREECYKVVTQALGELDSKLSEATASGNGKLFLTRKIVIELMDSRVNRG